MPRQDIHTRLLPVLIGFLLVGCSFGGSQTNPSEFESQPLGKEIAFAEALAADYRNLAQGEENNQDLARHYMARAALIEQGRLPVPMYGFDVRGFSDADRLDAKEARARLMANLGAGSRFYAPRRAARAQALYDCWLAEAKYAQGGGTSCRRNMIAEVAFLETARASGGVKYASLGGELPEILGDTAKVDTEGEPEAGVGLMPALSGFQRALTNPVFQRQLRQQIPNPLSVGNRQAQAQAQAQPTGSEIYHEVITLPPVTLRPGTPEFDRYAKKAQQILEQSRPAPEERRIYQQLQPGEQPYVHRVVVPVKVEVTETATITRPVQSPEAAVQIQTEAAPEVYYGVTPVRQTPVQFHIAQPVQSVQPARIQYPTQSETSVQIITPGNSEGDQPRQVRVGGQVYTVLPASVSSRQEQPLENYSRQVVPPSAPVAVAPQAEHVDINDYLEPQPSLAPQITTVPAPARQALPVPLQPAQEEVQQASVAPRAPRSAVPVFPASSSQQVSSTATRLEVNDTLEKLGLTDPFSERTKYALFFNVGSADLTLEAEDVLIDVISKIRASNANVVKLTGYPDGAGAFAKDKKLAEARLRSTERYLRNALGKDIRLSSEAGEKRELTADNEAIRNALQRRVDIEIY